MSHFGNIIGPDGPLLFCLIGLSFPREQVFRELGLLVPSAQRANLLIDTGASQTVIDQRYVMSLALDPTGTVKVHTPSTAGAPVVMNTYDVAIAFAGFDNSVHELTAHSVSAANFSGQGIDGLLGRDILANARLTYSGPDNFYYLSF